MRSITSSLLHLVLFPWFLFREIVWPVCLVVAYLCAAWWLGSRVVEPELGVGVSLAVGICETLWGFALWKGYLHWRAERVPNFRNPVSLEPERLLNPGGVSLADIQGAVARGWCAPKNEQKVMDGDLAFAIADEVAQLLTAEVEEDEDEEVEVKIAEWSVQNSPGGIRARIEARGLCEFEQQLNDIQKQIIFPCLPALRVPFLPGRRIEFRGQEFLLTDVDVAPSSGAFNPRGKVRLHLEALETRRPRYDDTSHIYEVLEREDYAGELAPRSLYELRRVGSTHNGPESMFRLHRVPSCMSPRQVAQVGDRVMLTNGPGGRLYVSHIVPE